MLDFIKKNKLISLIIFIALVVRIVGTIPGHNPGHPDEQMSYGSAVEMIRHGDLNPRRYDYPASVPLLHYVFYKTFILQAVFYKVILLHPEVVTQSIINSNFLTQYSVDIFGRNDIDALFWSRILTAILGAISVFIVYLIGKKLFNQTAGIAGAFFLTFNYRHVLSSHLALSDIPNSFFAILSFYISLLLLEHNTKKRYLLAGLLVGLSFSMKYQIFAALPFLFAHFFWVFKKRSLSYLFNINFLFALLLIPITFCVLNPYLLLNLKTAIPIIQYVGLRYGAGANRFNFYPLYYLYYWGIGTLPFMAIILGLIIGLFRSFSKILFILSYIFPFLFIFLYYMLGGSYIRNFTTVMPFFALLFGFFVSIVIRKLNLEKKWLILLVFLFMLNLQSITNSATLSTNYLKPWNRDILQNWAENNLSVNTQVRTDNVSLAYNADKPFNIVAWSHTLENSISNFSENGDKFAALNTDWYQVWMLWFGTSPKELLKNQGIPYDKLKGSYYGLNLSEYKHYTVKEIYKPWQSPDNNYLVIKIPPKLKDKGKNIVTFNFDLGIDGWKYYDFSFKKGKSDMVWNQTVGKDSLGSIELNGQVTNGEISRFTSPFVRIKEGKTYTVEGFVKPDDIPSSQRDGFLRLDFFVSSNSGTIKSESIFTALSERVYGNDWIKESVVAQAPKNTHYLTVSFQRANYVPVFRYCIDDVSVFESDEKIEENLNEIPYIKTSIPDNVLFPNSIY